MGVLCVQCGCHLCAHCIELMGKELLPAVREIGLGDPFSIDSPISLDQTPASQLTPQPNFTVQDLLAGR